MDEYNFYNYQGRHLFTYEGGYEVPPFFLLIPCESEKHANEIRSASIEGAELLYPESYWRIVVPMYMGEFMDCSKIANCLLNNPEFISGLASRIPQILQIQDNFSYGDNLKVSAKQDCSKDHAYGGCREVVEYFLDIMKSVCFLLQSVGSLSDFVTQLFSRRTTRRSIEVSILEAGNPALLKGSTNTAIIPYPGSAITQYAQIPEIIIEAVKYIPQNTLLQVFSSLVGLGTNLILADITDERKEVLACILFREVTCSGGIEKPCPYVLSTDILQSYALSLGTHPDSGVVGRAIGLCLLIVTSAGQSLSLFPFDKVFENYRVGSLTPSAEYTIVCQPCSPQQAPCQNKNYHWASLSSMPSDIEILRRTGGQSTQHTYQPNSRQEFNFGTNPVVFGELVVVHSPSSPCKKSIRFIGGRATANSFRMSIRVRVNGNWVTVSDSGTLNPGGGGVPNIDRTQSWNNTTALEWDKCECIVVTARPYHVRFEVY